ncbi:conserved hypothetical protein [Frankia sp. Hr75.2]|nr:conserved hypothetical protein [Frankia sp. Hr75.2]SQD94701.1 hypothetical protein FMEAI12_2720041 [Parafrankia sp. Ea1.12]
MPPSLSVRLPDDFQRIFAIL